uniref:ATP synthase F0 subunit 8 n=1 Tax=Metacrangonyx sp. 3 ssp. 1 MDMBR-2012 TaxID=1200666 RepID=K7ZWL1_9CRUS|nr:ATP synthase F0 subunit 8 [Metacrangonyx sp. 3 ssp. 1 MDMBR-2012]
MPQMAPSMWLLIYVVMCMMILFFNKYLFFSSKSKINFSSASSTNKIMIFLWQ